MKRQKAKPVKLDKNETICSKCETILTLDDDIISDEIIQCPNCDKIISNPFYFSGKGIICNACGYDGEVPKKFENTLMLNCPSCNNNIWNPHSDKFNRIICPICQIELHVSTDLFKEKYLECNGCGYGTMKNPYFKEPPSKKTFIEKDVHEDKSEFAESTDHSIDNSGPKKNYNYLWLLLFVFGIIIMLVIGYIGDSRNSSSTQGTSRTTTSGQQWYEGGTLHKAGILDWKRATDRNKLATCADFVSTYHPNLTSQQLRLAANEVKTCINAAIRGHTGFDNESVATVAVICMTGLGYID